MNDKQRSCFVMDRISSAADSIALGDMTEAVIYGRQEFSLMPVHAMFSCVLPSYITRGNMQGMFVFPNSLGQMSKTNKSWRLLKELQFHMRLHISGDKNAVRSSYLPALIPRLTKPLITAGAAGVDPVIQLMDSYYITREDWDSILELGLGDLSGDKLLKQIPTAAKSAFTRVYNKSVHHTPFAIESASKAAVGGKSKLKVYIYLYIFST
jgi:replication factor C subunit 1